jgi:hypothetical protein
MTRHWAISKMLHISGAAMWTNVVIDHKRVAR